MRKNEVEKKQKEEGWGRIRRGRKLGRGGAGGGEEYKEEEDDNDDDEDKDEEISR